MFLPYQNFMLFQNLPDTLAIITALFISEITAIVIFTYTARNIKNAEEGSEHGAFCKLRNLHLIMLFTKHGQLTETAKKVREG